VQIANDWANSKDIADWQIGYAGKQACNSAI